MFAYMSYLIYAKIDRLMVMEMIDEYNVGIYSAAYTLYEAPLFISLMVAKSIYPLIVKYYRENKDRLFDLYFELSSYMTLLAYLIVIFVYFFYEYLISFTFGKKYIESGEVLLFLSLGLILMFNAFLRSNYITASGNQKIILFTSIFSAIINILLNYIFINEFGVLGAAYATVLTEILSLLILNRFFKETRKIYIIQLKALLLLGIRGRNIFSAEQ